MNPYFIFIIAAILLDYGLNTLVAILNLKSLDPKLPIEFKDVFDEEKYAKSQEYTRAVTKFSIIKNTIITTITIAFIIFGGFNKLDIWARSFGFSEIITGLIFIGSLFFLMFLLELPFSLYSTFVIEERFGFNKTTIKTFIADTIKTLILSVLIGGPIIYAILWFFYWAGSYAWIYCWLTVTIVIIIIQFLAPVVILPLFNKFTPLEDGQLKDSIMNYVKRQKFPIKGIYTMDSSKRSTKLNAFFTGFGRFRRIVFFDTLIEKLTPNEIVAVLAHETGHFKLKHVLKTIILSIIQMGVMFYLLSLFINNRLLFEAFKMQHLSVYASIVFFIFLYNPISNILSIAFNYISRKHEFEADRFAVISTDKPEYLISALKKLSVNNMSNLTPHPLDVFLNYSHPPILKRIRYIKNMKKNEELKKS